LVVNAGSTSLKFGVFEPEAREALLAGTIDWPHGDREHATLNLCAQNREPVRTTVSVPTGMAAAACALAMVKRDYAISLVGHRVVHGGAQFENSREIDAEVKSAIAKLSRLAPLHNPPALEAIQAAEAALPGVPQIAVFDTAFFAQLPPRAYLYPLPYEWHHDWGVRRFGFHGISNSYCALRAREMLGGSGGTFPNGVAGKGAAPIGFNPALASTSATGRGPFDLRLITCHLGGGCSATAVRNGRPVATTMGFSPLEGLMMGSRSGSVDPGLLIYLQRECGFTLDRIDQALNYESGLVAVSGLSADLAGIEAAARHGNERAQLAFDMFTDRVRSAIGALAVTMGGVDALVFTDRIGENSAAFRTAVCQGLECLGVQLDPERNRHCQPDGDIATHDSPARLLVIRTREEAMIAQEAWRAVQPRGKG
jgi:acetate kinase